jgi:hypothetical protein
MVLMGTFESVDWYSMIVKDLLNTLLPARPIEREDDSFRRGLARLFGSEVAVDLPQSIDEPRP